MRALLHIGVEKTGSTAIQEALRFTSADLRTQGFHYLSAEMPQYQWGLPIYAAPRARVTDLLAVLNLQTDQEIEEYRTGFMYNLMKKVKSCHGHTFIFSEEHCHSRFFSRESVQSAYDFLAVLFDKIDIFLYLRRQDRLASSYYSNQLLGGECVSGPLFDPQEPYFDYKALLNRWSDVFGRKSINVAIYDEIRKNGRSIVEHFANWSGVPLSQRPTERRPNQSISNDARSVLIQINSRYSGEEVIAREARSFVERASSAICCDAYRPCRDAARNFYDTFKDSNKWIQENYFPNLVQLFDECFDEYPDDEVMIDASGALDVAVSALASATREYVKMRDALTKENAELSYYRGLVHFDAGRISEASASVDKGLSLMPEHSDLWNLRGRILQALGNLPEAMRALDRAVELDPANRGHAIVRKSIWKALHRTGRLSAIARIWRSPRTVPAEIDAINH